MMRRRHSTSLSRAASFEEDVNPNSYVSNIADCMLVLVLGFLVALVARYGVDLQADAVEPDDSQQMTGVEVDMDENSDGVIDGRYEQRGSVYYDSASGKYYFVQE